MQTPLEIMMGLAKEEIKKYIYSVIRKNRIPEGVMMYILKDIQLEITEQHLSTINNQYLNLQLEITKDKETQNGDTVQEGAME